MSQFPVVCKRNEEKHVFAHYVFPVFLCNLCDSLEPAYPVTAGKKKELHLGSKPCHPLYITKQVNERVLSGEKNS